MVLGSCNGKLWALDAHSGEVRWSYDISQDGEGRSFHGRMAQVGDTLAVGSDSPAGHLYAFDLNSGLPRWKHDAGRGVSADVLVHGQKVYALSLEGLTTAHDLATGKILWRHEGLPPGRRGIQPSPLLSADGRSLFVAGSDGTLTALDAGSGTPRWTQALPGVASTDLVWSGGGVYTAVVGGSGEASLVRLDPASGALEGRLELPGPPGRSLVAVGDQLLLYVVPGGGDGVALVAVPGDLSAITWRREGTDGARWSVLRPYPVGELVIVGDGWGQVVAFSLADGEPRWMVEAEETVKSIASGPGLLAVGTEEGTVLAYRFTPKSPPESPPKSP